MRNIYLLLGICLLLIPVTIYAQSPQPNWILKSAESGNKKYIARDYISLEDNFTYTATEGDSFTAEVNPSLLFPSSGNTYATENGVITTNPSLGAVVGSLSGNFDVTQTGGATYNIPIACSPGINGVQPNISLVYNSQGAAGIAGWGWNIGGLSMISRMPKNHYFDGEASGIIWDKTSPLALDGQRLLHVKTWGNDSIEYCTESETAIRIVGYNIKSWGPETFKVYLKNGNIVEYGNKNQLASYYYLNDFHISDPTSTIAANLGWGICKLTDGNRNFVEYSYTNDPVRVADFSELRNTRIDKIEYGNDNSGTKQVVGTVQFHYGNASDKTVKYIDGSKVYNQKILSKIEVKGASSNLLESYNLTYDIVENRDYLVSVKNVNASGEFIHPIKFEWNKPEYGMEQTPQIITFSNFPEKDYYARIAGYGDVNNDGLTDLIVEYKTDCFPVSLSPGTKGTCHWTLAVNKGNGKFDFVKPVDSQHTTDKYFSTDGSPMLIDIDGDGKDEFILTGYSFVPSWNGSEEPSVGLRAYKYFSGQGLVQWNVAHIDISKFIFQNSYPYKGEPIDYIFAVPADFLGNGNPQFLLFSKYNRAEGFGGFSAPGNENLWSVGLGEVSAKIDELINKYNVKDEKERYKSAIYITDINGNGKKELMLIINDRTYIYEYDKNENKFKNINSIMPGAFKYDDKIYIGDFNGDGNTDILQKVTKPWGEVMESKWNIYLSDGYTLRLQNSNITDYLRPDQNNGSVIITDVNGDGKSDILFYYSTSSSSLRETAVLIYGNGTFTKKVIHNQHMHLSNFTQNELLNNDKTIDFLSGSNGTLVPHLNNSGSNPVFFSVKKGAFVNKISKIKDSFGNELNVEYKSNRNLTVRNTFLNAVEEVNNQGYAKNSSFLPAQFEVVSGITSTNLNKSFIFNDPEIHRGGRGFLGFRNTQTNDHINGVTSLAESKMSSDFYLLYPYKQVSKTLGGTLINQNISNYTLQNLGNKKYFLRMDSQVSTDKLNNTIVTKTFSNYDASRNPKTIKTDYDGGISEEQTIEYVKKGSYFDNKVKYETTVSKSPDVSAVTRKAEYDYDGKGNVIKKITDPGDKNAVTTTYASYDKWGNAGSVSVSTNSISRTSKITYTPSGRFVKSKTNHLNETVSYVYNEARGLMTGKNDVYGTTTYSYDNFGRLTKTIGPDNIETVSLWQWAGSGAPAEAKYYIYTETSGESPITTWYDKLGREIRQDAYGLNGKKILVSTEYNAKGQVYRTSEPYFDGSAPIWASANTYDGYGRITKVVTPMGTVESTYTPLTVSVKSPEGTTTTVSNAAGQTVSQTTNGKSVNYTYYASGLTKTSIPEGGQPVTMEYDLQGNRTKLVDPDGGEIVTEYDGWGQLKLHKQKVHTSGDWIITNYNYKPTGLLESKVLNGEKTDYQYDNRNRVKGINIAGKHSQSIVYDHFDRVLKRTENINNSEKILTSETEYDLLGRVVKEIYPTGYYISNVYDKYSNLIQIKDQNNVSVWKAVETNAKGQLTKTVQGSVAVTNGFDSRGFPTSIVAYGVVDMAYSFNSKGNLDYRQDNLTNHKEAFLYDNMNRLTNWNIAKNGIAVKNNSVAYNATTGNITTKSDIGYTMNYGENGNPPHAVTSINGMAAQIPADVQNITYTDFKKVKNITEGSKWLEICYGVDQQRSKTIYKEGTNTLTRYYSFNYEEENNNGNIRKIHYISGGNGLAGVYIHDGNSGTFYSVYTDYQGSLIALALPNGTVQEKYAYDPWGVRRDPNMWSMPDIRSSLIVTRGYTMHEHLDAFKLINMNGRVYDPYLTMFLSPDPYIQAPGDWLNYNRYGYCLNNPFKYTDPSGEFFWMPIIIGAAVGAYAGASIQSGSWNFTKWEPDSWKGAIAGAFIGASTSGMIASSIGASGMTVTAVNGATVASKSWGLTSAIINSGALNVGLTAFSEGGWDMAWKSGIVGAAMGAWGATGGFGMVNSWGKTSNWIAQLPGKLGYQAVGTLGNSFGYNWASGKGLLDKLTLGVGPVNFTLGKGQKLLQLGNNWGNIVTNGIGFLNMTEISEHFGGRMHFDKKNLAFYYSGGIFDKMDKEQAWGPYAMFFGPTSNKDIGHESHHIWQSRAFGGNGSFLGGDTFLLNYALQGISGSLIRKNIWGGISGANHFENQAYNGWWWKVSTKPW